MSDQPTLPPQDLEAEEAVLGAMMVSATALEAALDDAGIRPEDFYRPRHRAICDAIQGLHSADTPVDALTVADELRRSGTLEEAGGPELVSTLASSTPVPGNAGHYAKIVVETAKLRRALEMTQRLASRILAREDDSDGLLEEIESEALALLGQGDSEGLTHVDDVMVSAVDRLEARRSGEGPEGLASGFGGIDRRLHGLGAGRLIVVAGRPGHGKSTLAINIADHVARRERKAVAFFSLEMTKEEIADKLLVSRGQINGNRFGSGALEGNEVPKVLEAANELSGSPLFIDDSSNITLPRIRGRCRKLSAQLGSELGLVVIDYLQLIEPVLRSRESNRVAEVSEISRGLKVLAGELGVPFVVCAQLNRSPEMRTNKRPVLSDLRESGSIENDANQVLLLFNRSLYDEDDEEELFAGSADGRSAARSGPGVVEAIVAKNRHGETGTCELVFQGEYSRFLESAA